MCNFVFWLLHASLRRWVAIFWVKDCVVRPSSYLLGLKQSLDCTPCAGWHHVSPYILYSFQYIVVSSQVMQTWLVFNVDKSWNYWQNLCHIVQNTVICTNSSSFVIWFLFAYYPGYGKLSWKHSVKEGRLFSSLWHWGQSWAWGSFCGHWTELCEVSEWRCIVIWETTYCNRRGVSFPKYFHMKVTLNFRRIWNTSRYIGSIEEDSKN